MNGGIRFIRAKKLKKNKNFIERYKWEEMEILEGNDLLRPINDTQIN